MISGVVSRVTIIQTHKRGLITPLITTPEPPFTAASGTRQHIVARSSMGGMQQSGRGKVLTVRSRMATKDNYMLWRGTGGDAGRPDRARERPPSLLARARHGRANDLSGALSSIAATGARVAAASSRFFCSCDRAGGSVGKNGDDWVCCAHFWRVRKSFCDILWTRMLKASTGFTI